MGSCDLNEQDYLKQYQIKNLIAEIVGTSNTVLSGSGAPGAGTGDNGDFYIDTDTWDIYGPKAAGAWPAGVSLVGADGADGANGTNGTNGTDGADGLAIVHNDDTPSPVAETPTVESVRSSYDFGSDLLAANGDMARVLLSCTAEYVDGNSDSNDIHQVKIYLGGMAGGQLVFDSGASEIVAQGQRVFIELMIFRIGSTSQRVYARMSIHSYPGTAFPAVSDPGDYAAVGNVTVDLTNAARQNIEVTTESGGRNISIEQFAVLRALAV